MPLERRELIESHRPYARALAAEIVRTLPPHASREDLDAAAELGLVEAAMAFDPSRGIQFKTFAYYRIRGSVYDAIRKMTWFSKSLYDQYRFAIAANDVMTGYSETAEPVPAWQAETEARRITGTIASCYLLSLEAERLDYADPSAISAETLVIDDEQQALVRQALGALPERNRAVLEGYYFEGLNLEEVGERMGLSKSWVCRMHARSIEMLRDAMADLVSAPELALAAAR
ncbi:MAG: sigma-70 family RNA polymerase sigma factor [Bryobacteraceae bacterium]